jgi:hypothetical protein
MLPFIDPAAGIKSTYCNADVIKSIYALVLRDKYSVSLIAAEHNTMDIKIAGNNGCFRLVLFK